MRERGDVEKIEGGQVFFKNGESEKYDVIIKCTGYVYEFKFLPKKFNTMGSNVYVPEGSIFDNL